MIKQYFEYGNREIDWLKSRDPIMGAAIDKIGHVYRPVMPDLFEAMIYSIVGQQISTKARMTVWNRMKERFKPWKPRTIASAAPEDIQVCGMTMRKAVCIRDIAASVADGSLNLTELHELSDEEVCKRLSGIKGIGTWTAEMLMTLSMQRKDIISWDDLAIHRGLRILYHHRKITKKLFNKYRRRYSPYATVASLYLWELAGMKG